MEIDVRVNIWGGEILSGTKTNGENETLVIR